MTQVEFRCFCNCDYSHSFGLCKSAVESENNGSCHQSLRRLPPSQRLLSPCCTQSGEVINPPARWCCADTFHLNQRPAYSKNVHSTGLHRLLLYWPKGKLTQASGKQCKIQNADVRAPPLVSDTLEKPSLRPLRKGRRWPWKLSMTDPFNRFSKSKPKKTQAHQL